MKLWIDADAAPGDVKDIVYRAAIRLAIQTVLVANQRLQQPANNPLVTVVRVEGGPDVADRHIEANVMANFSLRIITMQQSGQIPNYEASASHIFGGESGQRLARTGTALFGLYSTIWDTDEPHAPLEAQFARSYVRWAALVGGGTPEIQRNIIATRGLGLPRG